MRERKTPTSLSVVSSTTPDDRLSPPAHLGEPEAQIFHDVIRDWKGTRAAVAVLVTGLEAHMRARECRQILDDEGLTVVGRDGQTKAHPLCTVERQYLKTFQQTFRALGIKI